MLAVSEFTHGQTDSAFRKYIEFGVGIGSTEYMNSTAIPAGLPGTDMMLTCRTSTEKSLRLINKFEFFSVLHYASLKPTKVETDFSIPYRHFDLSVGVFWSGQLPPFLPKLTTNLGIGASFNAMAGGDKYLFGNNSGSSLSPYYNWYLSPDLYFNTRYPISKRVLIEVGLSLPLAQVGFFQEYEFATYRYYQANKLIGHILTPNTVSLFTTYFKLQSFTSLIYTLKETKGKSANLKLTLNNRYLNAGIHHNAEKMNNTFVEIGIQFLRK
jgi:hypothetical protein